MDVNDKKDQAILSELVSAQTKSMKKDSAFVRPNIWRYVMKNPKIKLAAVAIIVIAVFIGINPFGNSKTNIVWADVAEKFESVPFFHLTIYAGSDKSRPNKRVEIWKSEDGRVRAHEDNEVIFAKFSDGQPEIVGFDRSTREPVQTMGLTFWFLQDLRLGGRFSLKTLIDSMPSDTKELIPVETTETVASRDIVVFEARCSPAGEGLFIWALRESKLPIQMRFHDPRNNEYGDFLFDYSRPKDADFFDPNAFKNPSKEPMNGSTSENAVNVQEIVDVFRRWTVLSGGWFPSSLGIQAIKDIDPNADISSLKTGNLQFETPNATLDRDNPPSQEESDKYLNSVMFVLFGKVQEAMAETTDWHYAGKGVEIGETREAVLWCRPKGSKTYRVIYGDLSVKEVKPENLPK